MKKFLILIFISCLFIHCSKKLSRNASPEETAFHNTCKKCHPLPKTTKHTAKEWPATVDKMQQKAHFSDETKTQILAWLTAHAKK